MEKAAWLHKIRCTELERNAVDALAERDGLEYPEALRLLVREGAKAVGVWPADLLVPTAEYIACARINPCFLTDRDDTTHYTLDGLEDEP